MASETDGRAGFRPLEPARLESRPGSCHYADTHVSRGQGLEVSLRLLLQANGLPKRWHGRDLFTLAEIGFATGLNFLLTWDQWRSHPGTGWLHYLGVEPHPFTPPDMASLVQGLPAQLHGLGRELLTQYPEPVPGFHRLIFPAHRLTLTLMYGDASECLEACDARVDAWYLDGFAPVQNERFWNHHLYQQIARLSPPGASLVCLTAANHLRHGLETAGFRIEHHPGLGRSNEHLTGLRVPSPHHEDPRAPWFPMPEPATAPERQVTVVGAGLAGTSVALALARRGWEVTVVDQGPGPATGASGNPAGILMPHLSAEHGVVSRFTLQAAEFSRHWIESLGADTRSLPRDWCGALWLADGKRLARRQARIAERLALPETLLRGVDAHEASELAGVHLELPGLFLPRAGWVDPAALCRAQLESSAARVLFGRRLAGLVRQGDVWQLEDEKGLTITRSSRVVLANGAGLTGWLHGIEPNTLRGQLSQFPATTASRKLRRVLCYEGYVTPQTGAGHVCGASFVRNDRTTELRPAEHADNLASLARIWPRALEGQTPRLAGRAALRHTSPGRVPMVGPLPDMAIFDALYGDLHHGRPHQNYPDAPCLSGVYLSLAHGSRGLTSAALAAELLASQMHGDPLPLPRALTDALHPVRDRVRTLRRKP
jgi:tRNA 5-methylaminomethyl-2-thiouridine biosynthesis bifunctional protein